MLAVSAGCPAVGVVLHRGGFWSALRTSITHQDERAERPTARGIITVELFNFMLAEVGPILLERGIRIDVVDLASLITKPTIRQHLVKVSLADQQVSVDQLGRLLGGEKENTALLRVDMIDSKERA